MSEIARVTGSAGSGSHKPPSNAATVIISRDVGGELSLLLTHRNSKTAFGNMWVFPGGKVDPEDFEPDRPDDLLGASFVAAVREAKEEADVDLDTNSLIPYSHWTPPLGIKRRFLTWFFVAAAPPGPAADVTIDDQEIIDHRWLSPRMALELREAGEIELAPPTYVTLHHLSRFATTAELLSHAKQRTPTRFQTAMLHGDGYTAMAWEGDAAYPDGDPEIPGARNRIEIRPAGWTVLDTRP